MRKTFFEYSRERTSKAIYESLEKEEQKIINDFKDYMLISASEKRCDEARREVLRFREITGKDLEKIDLEDLRYFLKELQKYKLADYTKNKIKAFVHRFLKWKYRNWSELFYNFEDIRYNNDATRKNPITSKSVLTKEEIEKIMKTETSLYWKTFFITQQMGGLRTIETRKLSWEMVSFDEDGEFCYLEIKSKKNRNAKEKIRTIPLKEATYYLKELKKQQEEQGIITKWVFPGRNPKNYISKSVNIWFHNLTKKAIGRVVTNYTACRHTRGTELKKLVKENKLSKDNAIEFMGHSEEMFDKTYSHMDKEDVKKLMKEQLYNFEYMPEEKKHELEIEIENQNKTIEKLWSENKKLGQGLVDVANQIRNMKNLSKNS